MKKTWVMLFISPCNNAPIRMGKISEAKIRSILDSINRNPEDTDKTIEEGLYTELWNVEFYREDKVSLVSTIEREPGGIYVVAGEDEE